MKHAILFGDTHYPFHDEAALGVVKQIIKDVRPNIVVNMGDLIDAWQVSTFLKDPRQRDSLQQDIDDSIALLADIQSVIPSRCQLYYLEGNHEERLSRAICRMKEDAREIAGLRVFQQVVNWEQILKEAGMRRWQFIPMAIQSQISIIPRMVIKHGTIVSKWSAATAAREWQKYSKSGASGHTHRLGNFYHRDLNGTHCWVETGCTCDLNPTYTLDPDWHHGCVVLTYTDDWFNVETVYIEDGTGVWRDKEYSA